MNIRVLVILALFVGIGTVLHYVAPPIFGMKPDMLLAMMFLGILLFPKMKYVTLMSIATAIIAALTTTFPGGQISNLIDKPLTGLIFFGLYLLIRQHVNGNIAAPLLTAIGTLISGTIFLTVGLYILGADVGVGFLALYTTVVLPTTLINTIVMIVIYPLANNIMKRMQFATV